MIKVLRASPAHAPAPAPPRAAPAPALTPDVEVVRVPTLDVPSASIVALVRAWCPLHDVYDFTQAAASDPLRCIVVLGRMLRCPTAVGVLKGDGPGTGAGQVTRALSQAAPRPGLVYLFSGENFCHVPLHMFMSEKHHVQAQRLVQFGLFQRIDTCCACKRGADRMVVCPACGAPRCHPCTRRAPQACPACREPTRLHTLIVDASVDPKAGPAQAQVAQAQVAHGDRDDAVGPEAEAAAEAACRRMERVLVRYAKHLPPSAGKGFDPRTPRALMRLRWLAAELLLGGRAARADAWYSMALLLGECAGEYEPEGRQAEFLTEVEPHMEEVGRALRLREGKGPSAPHKPGAPLG